MERIETLVIGAGQAGLATSYHLTRPGATISSSTPGRRRHVAQSALGLVHAGHAELDDPAARARAAPGIRTGSCRETKSWTCSSGYASLVRGTGSERRRGRRPSSVHPRGAAIASSRPRRTARSRPRTSSSRPASTAFPALPAFAATLDPSVLQTRPATDYRNPESLPPGGVLVVGSAQSGSQIVEDLQVGGREVWLSIGKVGRLPRRIRGRDSFDWFHDLGAFKDGLDKVPDPRGRFAPNPHVSGARGGHTVNLHRFARDGVHLLGRVAGADGHDLTIEPDLHEHLAFVDRFAQVFRDELDKAIIERGWEAPAADPSNTDEHDGEEGFDVEPVDRSRPPRGGHRHDHLGGRDAARSPLDPPARSSTTRAGRSTTPA